MLSAPRPLVPSEHQAALSLWQEVFHTPPGYFERYYDVDPNYEPGDTLGVWDGDVLASAVHVCRRPVIWKDSVLLCGGIANVATRDQYRRQGLSRQILALMIAKMEQEGFHFSLLGTGTPGHYSTLGWELARRLQAMLSLASDLAPVDIAWKVVGQVAPLEDVYAQTPRPLQFVRSSNYFENWVGWDWRRQNAQIGTTTAGDYVVLEKADTQEALAILEWRAGDEATELSLFQAAAARAREAGSSALWLDANPQYLSDDALRPICEISRHVESGGMIRNITLAQDEYAQVAHAYQAGQAAWWPGDGF